MEQRYEANRQTGLWLERLAWNMAAGAALAVMILLLLGSMRWLDAISADEAIGSEVTAAPSAAARATAPKAAAAAPPNRATKVAEVNRPSP